MKVGETDVNLQTGPVVDSPQTGYQVPEGVLSLGSAALERSMPQIQGEQYVLFFVFLLLWNKTPAYFPLKDTLVGVDF